MSISYKNTIISLTMVIVVGLIAWTTIQSYSHKGPIKTRNTSLPDAYMEDIVALTLDKEGKPKMKLITPKMVHYPENDTSLITSPQLTVYQKSPDPWFITANHAKAMQGVDLVHFWENVIIHQPAGEDHPATYIKTSSLTVYPNKKLAQTVDLITLNQPNLRVFSKGMQANMDTGNIKLLSETRGEYVPS
jgi:lipopolysaccharide export system protein LptC